MRKLNCLKHRNIYICFNENSWEEISLRIQSGEIKFREFEERLGEMYGEDYGKMEAELKHMNVRDIKLRLDQLKKYRQLSTCVEGAKTILEFAQEYNLNGDFDQMEVIATVSVMYINLGTCNILTLELEHSNH
jgi:dethiobiotin synthetase